MRSSLPFFRVFPPPKFLLIPHVGLDISDDGFHAIRYSGFGGTRHISLSGEMEIPKGIFHEGDIKDEKEFVRLLSEFGKKHDLLDVKVSVPEEKAYLFHTEVPSTEQKVLEQNIEFKLEENVPLSADDSVFYFDLLPKSATGGVLKASVSVVPRTYIEHYMDLIKKAGLQPVSFEIVPKAIARSIIPNGSDQTRLIIHVMKYKTGLYLVSGNVIYFTFTGPWGSESVKDNPELINEIRKEISRIRLFWLSHSNNKDFDEALFVGKNSTDLEAIVRTETNEKPLNVRVSDVWVNAINVDKYVPDITKSDSLGYAVAAGLAFDTPRSV